MGQKIMDFTGPKGHFDLYSLRFQSVSNLFTKLKASIKNLRPPLHLALKFAFCDCNCIMLHHMKE